MKWEQYRSVMERYAIKTDDMATEDAYFMSTICRFRLSNSSAVVITKKGKCLLPPS